MCYDSSHERARRRFPADAAEVSDSSLAYDRGRKLGVYAAFGIPEVWVIEAANLVTHVHRGLGVEGYRIALDLGPDADVAAARAEGVAFSFSRLGPRPI